MTVLLKESAPWLRRNEKPPRRKLPRRKPPRRRPRRRPSGKPSARKSKTADANEVVFDWAFRITGTPIFFARRATGESRRRNKRGQTGKAPQHVEIKGLRSASRQVAELPARRAARYLFCDRVCSSPASCMSNNVASGALPAVHPKHRRGARGRFALTRRASDRK